jgi:hypothetical protein
MAFEQGYPTNLIKNPSFEADGNLDNEPDCWILITNYPNDYYLDSEEKEFGGVSLKIETYCNPGTNTGAGGACQWIDVNLNTTYTLSYYIKTDRPDSVLALPTIWEVDINGVGIGQWYAYIPLAGSLDWQREYLTFTTSSAAVKIKADAAMEGIGFSSSDVGWEEGEFYTSWIDGIQLEESGTLSDFHIDYPSCPEAILLATIDIDPDTLELKSMGQWITCYIELPSGYDVNDINVSTIQLNSTISAVSKPTEIGDYDSDNIPDRMVKFDRQAVINYLAGLGIKRKSKAALTITGNLNNGILFEGKTVIRVI